MEDEEEVAGEGEEEEGPGEGWGTVRPGCSGGGGGADVTTPPMTPALPPLLLPPKSKRPIPEWSCSWASAASAGWKGRRNWGYPDEELPLLLLILLDFLELWDEEDDWL